MFQVKLFNLKIIYWILNFGTYGSFLKLFPDTKFNTQFQTSRKFSGLYGNPNLREPVLHIVANVHYDATMRQFDYKSFTSHVLTFLSCKN